MKNDRKQAILDIVSKYEVDTQETLLALLMDRGYNVTQATISRDIKQLALVKTRTSGGGYKYTIPQKAQGSGAKAAFSSFFSDSVISVDRAMNTVVIKCYTGMANAVCSKLDTVGYIGIVGTLAGDDTIFVLMRTEADALELLDELSSFI